MLVEQLVSMKFQVTVLTDKQNNSMVNDGYWLLVNGSYASCLSWAEKQLAVDSTKLMEEVSLVIPISGSWCSISKEKYEKYQTDKRAKRFTLLYTMTSKNYKEVFQKYTSTAYREQIHHWKSCSSLTMGVGMRCGNTFSSILYSSQVLSICYLSCK